MNVETLFPDSPTEPDYFGDLLAGLSANQTPNWPETLGRSLRDWFSGRKQISALSLFTGGGGLDIGFHDVGFKVHSMVEIDERFVTTLRANSGSPGAPLGEAAPHCIDIREFRSDGLPKIDFVIGGPPCQTFSAAGRRAHGVLGVDDPRGVLFQEYVRLLHELEPEGFLFENVYGIVGAQGGEPWRLIVEGFQEAGFELSYRILDSADYGVPQHRERLFIVGRRSGTFDFPRPTHGPDSGVRPHVSAMDAIADLAGERSDGASQVGGRFGSLLEEIPPGLNYAYFTEKMGHPRPVFAWRSKFSDFLYKADPDFPVRTIKARGGQYTGPFHWENRPFSTHELQRLQTFPDEYMLVGNRSTRIEQIGNSVPPQMARMLALSVRDQVFDLETPVRLPLLGPQEQLSFRSLKRQRTELYERKAQAAIAQLAVPKKRARSRRQSYRADLSAAFALEARADGDLLVDISTGDEWVISVATEDVRSDEFEIELIPASLGWRIPADRVVLLGHLHPRSFIATWKAFERVLGEREIKADLVQLNGYYQYEPSINAKMTYDHSDPTWHVVSSVVAGHGVRAPSSGETLAFTWGVSADSIAGHCQFLRDLAYEVRNSNTNPQIPAGTWLIPYAFPTLNPKSVQLTKSLGPIAVDD